MEFTHAGMMEKNALVDLLMLNYSRFDVTLARLLQSLFGCNVFFGSTCV